MPTRVALALSAIAVILMLLAGSFAGPPEGQDPPPAPLAPGLALRLSEAARIEMTFRGATTTLVRQDGTWRVADRDMAPADQPRVSALLAGLAAARLLERRTDDPERLARLGLDDPAARGSVATLLRVLDGNAAVLAAVVVGTHPNRAGPAEAGTATQAYVRAADQNQAWLARADLPLAADPAEWLAHDLLSVPAADVASVAIRRDGEAFRLVREGGHLVLDPPGPPLDPFRADATAAALDGLSLQDIRPVAKLPGREVAQSTFAAADGLALRLTSHADGDRIWVTVAASGSDRAAAIASRAEGWAFLVAPDRAAALAPHLDQLRAYAPVAR